MAQVYRRTGAGTGGEVLDVYEYAYLAGGEQRVVESAIIALVERGTLSLRAARLRTLDAERARRPWDPSALLLIRGSRGAGSAARATRPGSTAHPPP
ncbi:TIGR04222 domain-containing membrane protein [Streptomyces virginiae]|uniref:TIGR04222 domain-containing membrane protein n=1 Tax=Streptomyces virginiae TaxID=1961 RepID=A0ABZ1TFM5_STRVG|nr:TIGR04222 domain-containing membrane protein [Streptomyces virginiae]